MRTLLTLLKNKDSFSKTLAMALFIGVMTILLVLNVQKSNDSALLSVGTFLGGIGNDLFLIISNLIIIVWAWRKRLKSVIKLTLFLDFLVWISVQGIKLLKIEPWYLRPNGGTGGFPSGHATHAFGMAFLLSLFFPRFSWLWYVCAVIISWSRVETAWHNGFQVAAGVILGVGLAWVLIAKWLTHPDAAIIKPKPIEQEQKAEVRHSYVAE
ncbi:MAG: superfamily protein [Pelosinus sp.]|jgi:membrane-associated phospholipid phosphatase|nr:superfamily protein [Pelosinus sp.]